MLIPWRVRSQHFFDWEGPKDPNCMGGESCGFFPGCLAGEPQAFRIKKIHLSSSGYDRQGGEP